VSAEMQRLGVVDGPASKRTPEQAAALKETQGLAEKVQAALLYKQQLLGITVMTRRSFNGDEEVVKPLTFDPAAPVTLGQFDDPGDKTWEDVNRIYKVNEQLLANLQATSPGVFATIAGKDLGRATTAAGDLATADPASAAAYLEDALSGLMTSSRRPRPMSAVSTPGTSCRCSTARCSRRRRSPTRSRPEPRIT
jgi:hypothetical protein